jgi:hypothetical protein
MPRRIWLCLPPLLLLALDAGLTLAGQPAHYWDGAYGECKELNPAAALVLGWHPALFLIAIGMIGVGLALGIQLLPLPLAKVFSLVAAFFSAVGASSWLVELGLVGWILTIVLLWSSERFVTFAWKKSQANGVA